MKMWYVNFPLWISDAWTMSGKEFDLFIVLTIVHFRSIRLFMYKKNFHCSIRQQFLFLAFFIEAIAHEKLPRNRINILWILFVTCRVLWFVVISGSLLGFFFPFFFSLLLCTFFSEEIAINSHANRKSTIQTHATTINRRKFSCDVNNS